jgi:hypothetical protein
MRMGTGKPRPTFPGMYRWGTQAMGQAVHGSASPNIVRHFRVQQDRHPATGHAGGSTVVDGVGWEDADTGASFRLDS